MLADNVERLDGFPSMLTAYVERLKGFLQGLRDNSSSPEHKYQGKLGL
jgi:hypothetical protein